MSPAPESTLADPQQVIADLQRKLEVRAAECDEALAREAAIAEVLQIINSSPGDLVPVFDAMLEKATLTDDPLAAVIPLVLKLASELEIVICPVEAEPFMPSEVAFSAAELLTTMRLFVFASNPMASMMACVWSTSTSTFGATALAARIPDPPLFFKIVLITWTEAGVA